MHDLIPDLREAPREVARQTPTDSVNVVRVIRDFWAHSVLDLQALQRQKKYGCMENGEISPF